MKKQTTYLIFIILTLATSSCDSNRDFRKLVTIQKDINKQKSLFEANYISETTPPFLGKSKYKDTISIPYSGEINTKSYKDFYYEENKSQILNGFEITPIYNSNIYRTIENDSVKIYNYYPVYITNQTPSIQYFNGKDSHIFGIQEALDTNGRWYPIEMEAFDFCGDGNWKIEVKTEEFLICLFPKYKGNFKTKLRVRITNGNNILVSKPFEGIINRNQFYVHKDTWYFEDIVKNNGNFAKKLFYGAIPKNLEEK
jgi:hypothetical protein